MYYDKAGEIIGFYTENRKNAPQCFCRIFYKTRPILIKLGTYYPK